MTPGSLDRVFGTSRLKMVTGQYVEVYREAAEPGERRRYTKRFLRTPEGDFRQWTEREWRILARLVGHGARHVPDVVQYDRGASGGPALVQTYDAGITVDHWATLLPVQRGSRVQQHLFQDCAHWWGLARYLLLALHEIHSLRLVHLDLKADNICLPYAPPGFAPPGTTPVTDAQPLIYPVFEDIALIDFAFSMISGEQLTSPLPIGWQRAFPYQSPRLLEALLAGQRGDLEPTQQLDWRCDMFSLAALLNCFVPSPADLRGAARERGWTDDRHRQAHLLLLKIRDSHDSPPTDALPHLELAAACAAQSAAADMIDSVEAGWTLADVATAADIAAPTATWAPTTLIEPHPSTNHAEPSDGLARPVAIEPAFAAEPVVAAAPTTLIVLPESGPAASPQQAAGLPEPATPLEPGVAIEPTAPFVRATAAAVPAGTTEPAATAPDSADAADAADAADRADAAHETDAAHPPEIAETAKAVDIGQAAETAEIVNTANQRWRPAHGVRQLGVVAVLAGLAIAAWQLATPDRSSAPSPPSAPLATRDTLPVAQADLRAPASPPPPPPPLASAAAASPAVQPAPAPGQPAATDPYAQRSSAIVTQVLPGVAQRALPQIAQVLASAAQARDAADDRRTLQAAATLRELARPDVELQATTPEQAARGRQLNAAAQRAFWQDGNVARAFQLQWQAFGAHPHDAEIAGNLAFYALKSKPRQVELSRLLAVWALTGASRNSAATRLEDWGNLAVASALSGRSEDATHAMLVFLSLSRDVDRSCRSALSSVATFGPALKGPAEAVLLRANARGSAPHAPHCQWPPRWHAGSRIP